MPMWGTQQDTRPPPPDGAPPAYTTVIRRVYKGSMRGVLIFTAFLGMLWALVMGVEEIKDMSQSNETAKMKVFALVIAILYFVVAGVEAALIVIAVMKKPNFGQLIRIIGPLGFALVVGANVLTMARHFSLKTDLIYQCVQRTTGQGGWSSSGGSFTFSQDQAQTACENAWNKRTWTVVGWFLVSIILAGIFLSIALSYRRELLDPSSRQTTQRFEAYPMQTHPNSNPYGNLPPPPGGAYNSNGANGGPHGQGQGQGWQVPPYPGPPAGGAPNAYEKGDYHPQADWANAGVGADSTVGSGNGNRTGFGYDIPPGSPPRGGAGAGEAGRPHMGDRSATQAQDEAWLEAQRTGPTAHLTSPTSPRRNDNASGGAGGRRGVIANEEEDEAWARARREGVTAHLTGGGAGGKGGGGVV